MPPLQICALHQRCILWEKTGRNSRGEVIVTDLPLEIDCRWEWGQSEMIDPAGTTVAVDAMVVVDRRIEIGSQMWLGLMKDLPPGTSFVDQPNELMWVAVYYEIPDDKGREFFRTVGLRRLRDIQ